MAGKKAAPANNAELAEEAEGEGWEEESGAEGLPKNQGHGSAPSARMRDWRDVEKLREMRELRRLVDDDFGLDEIAPETDKSKLGKKR